jgi:hypothetical protein
MLLGEITMCIEYSDKSGNVGLVEIGFRINVGGILLL